jgi:hypothetical protein
MFEHICHIMAKVQGQEVSLSTRSPCPVPTTQAFFKHIAFQKMILCLPTARLHNLRLVPLSLSLTSMPVQPTILAIEIKRHLENLFVEPSEPLPGPGRKNALDLYIEKTSKEFLTTKATIMLTWLRS